MKEIPDYKGYYIDREGQVWCTLGKGCRRDKGFIGEAKPYRIKPRAARNGYLRVCMRQTSTGRRRDRYIHRLVATAFIPHSVEMNVVNHKNCDRTDNRVSNLEWTTSKGNNDYSMAVGHLKRDPRSGRFCA